MSKAAQQRKAQDMAQAIDQEDKKSLVLYHIAERCRPSSEFSILRSIGEALQQGKTLTASIITGGKTNYSYKVFVKEEPHLAVYSKISFSFALWNPDRSVEYDTERTVNEFAMMEYFADLMKDEDQLPVARPLFLVDVTLPDGALAKLVATEWASVDEQWGTQFQDGHADPRVVTKVARALAKLNLQPITDTNFNDNVRPTVKTLIGVMKGTFAELLDTVEARRDGDYAMQIMRKMGVHKYNHLQDVCYRKYNEVREVLCHNDSHAFNILVAPKPAGGGFAESDHFILCDWEQAIPGEAGKDAGLFNLFPIICALCHAVQGHEQEARHLLQCTIDFWDEHAHVLKRDGHKDESYLCHAFKGAMGVFACYGTACYMLHVLDELYPLEGVSPEKDFRAREAFGAVSFKFLEMAHAEEYDTMDYESLRIYYKDTITWYMDELLHNVSDVTVMPRRSSSLRRQGRRVSDAAILEDIQEYRRLSSIVEQSPSFSSSEDTPCSSLEAFRRESCESELETVHLESAEFRFSGISLDTDAREWLTSVEEY